VLCLVMSAERARRTQVEAQVLAMLIPSEVPLNLFEPCVKVGQLREMMKENCKKYGPSHPDSLLSMREMDELRKILDGLQGVPEQVIFPGDPWAQSIKCARCFIQDRLDSCTPDVRLERPEYLLRSLQLLQHVRNNPQA